MATGGRDPEARSGRVVTAAGGPPPASPSGGAVGSARSGRSPRSQWPVVFLALVVAALIILVSSVVTTGSIDWALPFVAYAALLQGAFGSTTAILNTILQATPLVLGGLAVGVGFKAGLFNIGGLRPVPAGRDGRGRGRRRPGDRPAADRDHPGARSPGMLAGAAWGWIPGALKAWSGAHEVVTTIMLNSIAGGR